MRRDKKKGEKGKKQRGKAPKRIRGEGDNIT